MSSISQLNVFSRPLVSCCTNPLTGYRRNGFCETIDSDHGTHTVCAVVSSAFLNHQKTLGNDLITPSYSFPGLKEGDRWCLCATRWKQGLDSGYVCKIDLEATNIKTLDVLGMTVQEIQKYQVNSEEL